MGILTHLGCLDYNGNTYAIRVMEEQFIIYNYSKAKCDCKGYSLDRVVSCPKSNEGSDDDIEKGEDEDVMGDKGQHS